MRPASGALGAGPERDASRWHGRTDGQKNKGRRRADAQGAPLVEPEPEPEPEASFGGTGNSTRIALNAAG